MVVRMMLAGPVTAEDIEEKFGCSHDSAQRALSDPQILRRLRHLMDCRVNALASEALLKLRELMRGDDRRVSLRAAVEILDRSGFTPPVAEAPEVQPAFSLIMNLGGQPDDTAALIEAADREGTDLDQVPLPSLEAASDSSPEEPADEDTLRRH